MHCFFCDAVYSHIHCARLVGLQDHVGLAHSDFVSQAGYHWVANLQRRLRLCVVFMWHHCVLEIQVLISARFNQELRRDRARVFQLNRLIFPCVYLGEADVDHWVLVL